jgi:hypothetical protein
MTPAEREAQIRETLRENTTSDYADAHWLLAEVDRLRGLEALAPYTRQLPPFSYTIDIPTVRLDAVERLRDYIVEQRNAADSVARDPSLGHIGIAFVTANVYTGILTKGIDFGVFPLEPEESEVPS